MESQRDPELMAIHNRSLLTVPDGMPLVWIGRRRLGPRVSRAYGPDLMSRLFEMTRDGSVAHCLLGGTDDLLDELALALERRHPGVRITGRWAPPFRPMTEGEWAACQGVVERSGAELVWVGMSTPRQERFMAEYLRREGAHDPAAGRRGRVLIGVGAAFDVLSGRRRDAPAWMKRSGLQWLHRLLQEPRRLGPRYLRIVPAFLWRMAVGARPAACEPPRSGDNAGGGRRT